MNRNIIVRLIVCVMLMLTFSSCDKDDKQPDSNTPQGCDIIDDCGDDNGTYGMTFKEAYESLNGKTNKSGKEHRTVSIPEDNPIVQVDAKEIVRKIENKETFYLYVGDEMCPWCRSVIEKALEIAKAAEVDEILYLQIWDDEGNEILRDKYVIEDGELKQTVETSEEYGKLLDYFRDVLADYTLTDDNDETVEVGEKRIYAPNFFYVKNGVVIRFTTGTSEKQEESRQELSDDILADEIDMFEELFGVKQ